MFKFFYRLFNHDKIDSMQQTLDVYKERNEQLEKENSEYKGYKLKYQVTKLYVEDDEALLDLFEIATKIDEYNLPEQLRNSGVSLSRDEVATLALLGLGGYGYGGGRGVGYGYCEVRT